MPRTATSYRFRLGLAALALAALASPAWASLPQVANLQVQTIVSPRLFTWPAWAWKNPGPQQ
ncbi:MAG TPA: hypothetical protein VFD06_08040 [Candidatus Polarisedimenticolia bacterium]|nr:hypothetical protein [Candidatus Polarisedimenticolia bacterium]